jgi:hypothetical protein
MLIDAIAGLVLLVALATLVARGRGLQARTEAQLHDQSAAFQDAQTVLAKLQSAPSAKAPEIPGAKVSVTALGRHGNADWVEVRVEREGRSASLIGAVSTGGAR